MSSGVKRNAGKGSSSRGRMNIPQPSAGQHDNPQRVLSHRDKWLLLQDLSENDLEWMLSNESLPIRDFINTKLGKHPETTQEDETDTGPCIPDLLSQRTCGACCEQDPKDQMVKCRGCHEWYHLSHYKIKTRSDVRCRFFKCNICRKKYLGGPTLTTATRDELEEDNHFEDSDNEILA